jgi:hypothetical protein
MPEYLQNKWMDKHSQYGSYKPHNYHHVIRNTGVEINGKGVPEHYFHKDIFKLFRAEDSR